MNPATGRVIDPLVAQRPTPPHTRCAFCETHVDDVHRLIAGRAHLICDQCVRLAAAELARRHPRDATGTRRGTPSPTPTPCAFCGAVTARRQYGLDPALCDLCVDLCLDILDEDAPAPLPVARIHRER